MNPLAIIGAVAAAGYGIYKAATATKEVTPAMEATLVKQAVPIAVQQVNAGVPANIAAQVASKAVVDAVMVPAGTPTTPWVDPNPPHIAGDPKAGPWYVRWIVSPWNKPKQVWIRYFATQAERNLYSAQLKNPSSIENVASGGLAPISDVSVGPLSK